MPSPTQPMNEEELTLDDISTYRGLVDAIHKFAKNLTQRSLDMDAMIKNYDMVDSQKGEILTSLIESFVYTIVKTRENMTLADRNAAIRGARIDTAKHIQGHLMADEPKVIASRRTEDQDNTWFTAQLTFSNYISDDVIDPYIAALQSQPNAKEDSNE